MTAPSCAWVVAALGPDESSRVDLVTGDLDVYVSSQDLEHVEVRKSLEFAEIRRRLQDAEVELVSFGRVCQRITENLSLSGAERDGWCLRCYPRSSVGVHLDSGVRGKMSRKRTDEVRAEGVDQTDR